MRNKPKTFRHEFVRAIPHGLEPDTLYVSMEYATAVHLCACGCRQEVVTPLSPVGWSLHFDGISVSLDPSIGNWSYPCRSHYVIRRDGVVWAPRWSSEQIQAGRDRDKALRESYYGGHAADDSFTPAQRSGWLCWLPVRRRRR